MRSGVVSPLANGSVALAVVTLLPLVAVRFGVGDERRRYTSGEGRSDDDGAGTDDA